MGLVQSGAWIALAWERAWPLLVPLFMVQCTFLAFSWAGGWHYLQTSGSLIFLWLARLAFAGSFFWAVSQFRNFRLPLPHEISRRIEIESNLENRPITAQEDEIAMGGTDGFALALWQEHRNRMAGQLNNLTSGTPAPQANRFDPFAVRAMLPLLAFAAFFFSFSPSGGRIADAYHFRSAGPEIPDTY